MPFKSKAQRRFFYAAEARGELPKGTAARWEEETPKGKKLPEKVAAMKDDVYFWPKRFPTSHPQFKEMEEEARRDQARSPGLVSQLLSKIKPKPKQNPRQEEWIKRNYDTYRMENGNFTKFDMFKEKNASWKAGFADVVDKTAAFKLAAQVYTMGDRPSDGRLHYKEKGKKGSRTYGKMGQTSNPEVIRTPNRRPGSSANSVPPPNPEAQRKRARRAARHLSGDRLMPNNFNLSGSDGRKTIRRAKPSLSGKQKAGLALAALLATAAAAKGVEIYTRPE